MHERTTISAKAKATRARVEAFVLMTGEDEPLDAARVTLTARCHAAALLRHAQHQHDEQRARLLPN